MSFDLMGEGIKAIQRGDLDIREFMNQIETITNMHLLTKVSTDRGEFEVDLDKRGDGGNVKLHVKIEVLEGQAIVDEVVNEVNSFDRAELPDLMNKVIHRNEKEDEPTTGITGKSGNWS